MTATFPNTKNSDRVGVIGGGLGGLAAACTLAARGYEVTLFEQSAHLGGKANQLNGDGFRFDMGPTIVTVPETIERIFAEAGRKTADYLNLVRLDPQWRCFYDDGSVLDLEEDVNAMSKRLDNYTGSTETSQGYRNFQALSDRLSDISDRYFFWKSIGGIKDMIDFRAGFSPKILSDVLSMRMGRSVSSTVRKYIPDARVAQMIDHFTQYVGSSPDASPAILCGIASMQVKKGIWYPMGGTRAVPEALIKLATDLGVDFKTETGVRRICTNDKGQVTGLETEAGQTYQFAAVVSNADSVRTHRELLDGDEKKFEKRRGYEPACSGVVLYLGLKQRYEHLLHHNFVFSHNPEAEFHSIYDECQPASDPTCYLCAPSHTEVDVAPPSGEALYVLVHTPYLRPDHDWQKLFPRYRKIIINKLKTTGQMPDIEDRIVYESALTPQDIHDRYRVLDGAIYGLASHGKWTGAFKPGNRSPDHKGLYLCGGSAHPGPGMPMALMSGWIAADTMDQDRIAPKVRPPANQIVVQA